MSEMPLTNTRREAEYISIRYVSGSPDPAEWEQRPKTQLVSEKATAAPPYLAGCDHDLEISGHCGSGASPILPADLVS